MAALGMKDFLEGGKPKTSSSGKYSGKTRAEIVLEKIKNKDPFILGKVSGGQKVYGISFDTTLTPYVLSYATTIGRLKSKPEGALKITQLFKDPDFGGGAGSGGGAEDTKYTESGQCYYTSLVFNITKRPLKLTDCTPTNLQKAAKYVDATITLKDFLDKGPPDWFENQIYLRTANLIFKDYKKKMVRPVYCHRGSPFMNNVYTAKQKVMKVDKFSSPGSFSHDKWNPGDIWLSSLRPNEQPLKESKDWSELNTKVLELAGELKDKKTKLLGVSLKKLGTSGKVDRYNGPKRKHNISVKFKGFSFGKTGDFFSSVDVYLKFSVAEVQLRAFNTTSAWQGEIKGLAAAGGKIGGGNLNYYLEKHAKKSIGYTGQNKTKGLAWKEMTTGTDMRKMYDLYVQFNRHSDNVTKKFETVSFNQFQTQAKKKGNGFIFSKNMCLMFLNSFLSSSPVQRNNISTEVVRYAASNTDISSFYIKVN